MIKQKTEIQKQTQAAYTSETQYRQSYNNVQHKKLIVMKTKQMATTKTPITSTTATATTTTTTTTSASYQISQQRASNRTERSRTERSRTERSRSTQGIQCERERIHEAAATAKREQEEQLRRAASGKRQSMAVKSVKLKTKPESRIKKKRSEKSTVSDLEQVKDNESALRFQLKNLAHLSEEEFEKGFRQWMDQEGISREMHAQLRMDLINSFNKTSLGRLLSKTTAGIRMDVSPSSLSLSPLSMALHTLVAEYLHVQNCHYTLSVYCSEIPHRETLPDFEDRPDFRFTCEELKEILIAVLGKEEHMKLYSTLEHLYLEHHEKHSLLLALLQCMVDSQSLRDRSLEQNHVSTMTSPLKEEVFKENLTTNRKTSSYIDISEGKNQEVVANTGERNVFIGPRVSESLHNVEKQLKQLIQQMFHLSKSCSPPVEVVSQAALESLLQQKQQKVVEKDINREDMLIQLPGKEAVTTPTLRSPRVQDEDSTVVNSSAGLIKLPAPVASVPKMPKLHPEQIASLARVRQGIELLQKKFKQPQASMYMSIERMETLLSELCGCVQLLSNVLNLAMEQEHAVGLHKGFKIGYREGFSHGHFMGVQEGSQKALKKLELTMIKASTQTDDLKVTPEPILVTASTQTQDRQTTTTVSGTQTIPQRGHDKAIGTDIDDSRIMRESAVQTSQPEKTYEEWIHEMLHSSSGQIFLERVELSLNKALEQQKKRLDELYNVKLRHHSEMLRLNRRQTSWRALCRRVERDSQSSTEAKDLVHKIFRLLEHYESHHRVLAEKIHETELAAEQAARIMPIWSEANVSVGSCGTGTIIQPTLSTIDGLPNPMPTTLPVTDASLPSFNNQQSNASYSATNIAINQPYQVVAVSTQGLIPTAAPVTSASPLRVELPAVSRVIPLSSSVSSKPNLNSITTKSASCPVALSDKPVLPSAHSFDEALLSAKNRMLSLERESDLLEQSFVSYIEQARSQKSSPISPSGRSIDHHNILASCLRERQNIHRTLDSFRDWHRRLRLEDQIEELNDDHIVTSPAEGPLSISSPKCLSEKDPDSYQFTNAIAVARRKLFNEMSSPHLVQSQLISEGDSCLFRNWFHSNKLSNSGEVTPIENELLPSEVLFPPEITMTGSSSNADITLAISRAKLALDSSWCSSSSSSTTATSNSSFLTLPNGAKPSRKLQSSIAKMHQLFGGSMKPAKRPMSAPLSGTIEVLEPDPPRPHTAPRLSPVSSSSSPELSYSQEFWKRVHL